MSSVSQQKPLNRSSARRAQWRQHLMAQAASGLTQAAYCREYGLNEKYLSLWKRKLRAPTEVPANATADIAPAFIPVVVKRTRSALSLESARAAHQVSRLADAGSLIIKATLRNGVALEVSGSSATALLPLLSSLAQLPC